MKRRYAWIGSGNSCRFKIFKYYAEMLSWAKDSTHDGIYYISCPNVTFKKTREQMINLKDGKQ